VVLERRAAHKMVVLPELPIEATVGKPGVLLQPTQWVAARVGQE